MNERTNTLPNPMQMAEAVTVEDHSLSAQEVLLEQQTECEHKDEGYVPRFVP